MNIDHSRGIVYISGTQATIPSDPLYEEWREKLDVPLFNIGFVPLNVLKIDKRFKERHHDYRKKIETLVNGTNRSGDKHAYRKMALRHQLINPNTRLIKNHADLVVIMYDLEYSEKFEQSELYHEAQLAWDNGIPIYVITNSWQDLEKQIPEWLYAISTRIFFDTESLLTYLSDSPNGVFLKDINGNRGREDYYICSLTGEYCPKGAMSLASTVTPLYKAVASAMAHEIEDNMESREAFISNFMDDHYIEAGGLNAFKRMIQTNPDIAHGWLCNVSCAITDAGGSDAVARKAAEHFMNIAFDSKMTFEKYDEMSRLKTI